MPQSCVSGCATAVGGEFADAYGVARALLSDRGVHDGGVASAATERMLRHCLAVNGAGFLSALANEAEYHGVASLIAPMIAALARTLPDAIPEDVRRAFVVLASRQRRAAAAREKCIDDLLAGFAKAGILIILLKGAALAHRIYPRPELRPMVDIDVLIDPADVARAVSIARDLGYAFARQHGSRFAGRMHHLPVATMGQSGFRIALEIHLDTMSPNQSVRLNVATLAAKPVSFRRGSGPDGMALGHVDMLRHLARHAFEPARRVRLIHLYDLWRYQAIFCDEIDWLLLQARFPEVIVVLRLVSHVFAEPQPAIGGHDFQTEPVPAGVGFGMLPLSEIAATNIGLLAKLAALINPPAWWLHGFYGVPPEKSLLVCRTVRHPATVARWLALRMVAGILSVATASARDNHDQQNLVSKEKR